MENKNKIKAVIFDFDGVLVNTDLYHFLAWKKAVRKIGLNIDPSIQNEIRGLRRNETLNKILSIFKLEISKETKNDVVLEKDRIYKNYLKEITNDDILPGIFELFKFLKKENYKIGVASVSKNAKKIIESLNISKYIDIIVDINKIENFKPEPDIFLMAAKELNVKPWECIGVEDSQVGIDAINSSFMRSIGIDFHGELKRASLNLKSTALLTPDKFKEFVFEFQ